VSKLKIFGHNIKKQKLHARKNSDQIKFGERLLLFGPESAVFPSKKEIMYNLTQLESV
jgi:hypothetical protein